MDTIVKAVRLWSLFVKTDCVLDYRSFWNTERWKMVVWKLTVYHETVVSATESLPKWRQSFFKNVFKTPFFVKKLKISCSFGPYDFVQISLACNTNIFERIYGETLDFMSALAKVAWKSFKSKFTAKIGFPIGYFMLPLLMLTLKVKNLSMRYLISIWATCWWNLNKFVWSKLYNLLNFLTKCLTIFDKILTPFGWCFCDWNIYLMLKY